MEKKKRSIVIWWNLKKLRGKDSKKRFQAERKLAELGDPVAIDPLAEALQRFGDSDAAQALARIGGDRAFSALQSELLKQEKNSWRICQAVVCALGGIRHPGVIDCLSQALADPALKAASIDALIANPDPRTINLLLAELAAAPKFETRKSILSAMQQKGWQPSDDRERALAAIAEENWPEVVRIGSPAVEPLLKVEELLRKDCSEPYINVVDSLLAIGDETSRKILLEVFKNDLMNQLKKKKEYTDNYVQGYYGALSIVYILKIGGPDAVAVLLQAMERIIDSSKYDPHSDIKKERKEFPEGCWYGDALHMHVVDWLGEMGDQRAVQPLLAMHRGVGQMIRYYNVNKVIDIWMERKETNIIQALKKLLSRIPEKITLSDLEEIAVLKDKTVSAYPDYSCFCSGFERRTITVDCSELREMANTELKNRQSAPGEGPTAK